MQNMNKIGKNIRIQRELLGISQEYLATELSISQPSYARLEQDDKKISITRLMHIAKILKSTVAELIGEPRSNIINQHNNENPYAYVHNLYNADKDHIKSLKQEISFLKTLLKS